MNSIFKIKPLPFFLFLILFYSLTTFIMSDILITKQLFYQSYGDQLALEQIDAFMESSKKWAWVGYVVLPVILLIKVCLVAFCLNIGTIFAGLRTGFKELFRVVLVAQLVFVFATLIKTGWLLAFADIQKITDIQFFYPLSILNFFDTEKLESWYIYPLQTASVFELFYWLLMAKGLEHLLGQPFQKMLRLVVSSYGLGLLVWMVIVVFISLNIS